MTDLARNDTGTAPTTPAPPQPGPATPAQDHLPPFMRYSGFVVDTVSGTRVTGHLDVGPDQHTPYGIVHGGVYATTAETAASIGACAAVADQGRYAVGVTNTTDFLRPMTAGRAEVVAEPVMQGRGQQLWQVTMVRGTDGKIVARSTVRLQNLAAPSG